MRGLNTYYICSGQFFQINDATETLDFFMAVMKTKLNVPYDRRPTCVVSDVDLRSVPGAPSICALQIIIKAL